MHMHFFPFARFFLFLFSKGYSKNNSFDAMLATDKDRLTRQESVADTSCCPVAEQVTGVAPPSCATEWLSVHRA